MLVLPAQGSSAPFALAGTRNIQAGSHPDCLSGGDVTLSYDPAHVSDGSARGSAALTIRNRSSGGAVQFIDKSASTARKNGMGPHGIEPSRFRASVHLRITLRVVREACIETNRVTPRTGEGKTTYDSSNRAPPSKCSSTMRFNGDAINRHSSSLN